MKTRHSKPPAVLRRKGSIQRLVCAICAGLLLPSALLIDSFAQAAPPAKATKATKASQASQANEAPKASQATNASLTTASAATNLAGLKIAALSPAPLPPAAQLASAANSMPAEVAPLPSLSRDSDIVIAVKQQLPLPGGMDLRRIAVADPTVADVVVIKDGVLLVGKKAGSTVLTVWPRGAGSAPRKLSVYVQSELAGAVLDARGPQVTVHGGTAVISGNAPSMFAHERAAEVAADSAPKVLDSSTVAPGGVVQVDVKIVEFSKSVLKQAGFNLFTSRANGFGFGLFGASSLNSFTGSPNNVAFNGNLPIGAAFNLVAGPVGGMFASLSVLETNGLARVLAEPTLVALSGQSASFLAGGELPIPEAGGLGTTNITYKSFGIGLSVTPTVLSPVRIALKVAPEASDLDYSNAVTLNGVTVPSITIRRADTTVELGDGESFVIGGLVSRSTSSNVSKVPLLGDLPIIGTFFKQLNYQQQENELVIIVTPHIVQAIAKGVSLPLPGEQQELRTGPVWGDYVMGIGSRNDMPGFSN